MLEFISHPLYDNNDDRVRGSSLCKNQYIYVSYILCYIICLDIYDAACVYKEIGFCCIYIHVQNHLYILNCWKFCAFAGAMGFRFMVPHNGCFVQNVRHYVGLL